MIKKLINWWNNRRSMYILVKEDTSEVVISKGLFDSVQKDQPDAKNFRILFARIKESGVISRAEVTNYCMFFNPQWEKHGISNPNMVLTTPLTVGKNNHVGFQTVQPTVAELAAMYGISGSQDFVRLNIKRRAINDEPYYVILRP